MHHFKKTMVDCLLSCCCWGMAVGWIAAGNNTPLKAQTTEEKFGKATEAANATGQFQVQKKSDRLLISLNSMPVAEFVYNDEKILRPYFSNLRLPSGIQLTRNHPPVAGADPSDHDTMHPGIWLGLGDLSGSDFWRNKGRMEHLRFEKEPISENGSLKYSTQGRLLSNNGDELCQISNQFTLVARPVGWMLIWKATFLADLAPIQFGDQEEMGFGARVATAITEKNGGRIVSSKGLKTAKLTWGQAAAWCDYSGRQGDRAAGILLMASPQNFRNSWWHNRDYGVFVANPFGQQAMKQGEKSSIAVQKGQSLVLCFGAVFHEELDIPFDREFEAFIENSR